MIDLNNLGLSDKAQPDVDFENMPTGVGGSIVEPPQPGMYLFRLPSAQAIFAGLEEFDYPEQGKRLRASFRDISALTNLTLNQPYNVNMTNATRVLHRKTGDIVVSDLAQVLKAVGVIPISSSNAAYAKALIDAAEQEFIAESTLTANCSPTRDTYRTNPQTGRSELTTVKGCGQKFRVEGYTPKNGNRPIYGIPRDTAGRLQLRFECPCGAEIRAWGSLQGIRPAK